MATGDLVCHECVFDQLIKLWMSRQQEAIRVNEVKVGTVDDETLVDYLEIVHPAVDERPIPARVDNLRSRHQTDKLNLCPRSVLVENDYGCN